MLFSGCVGCAIDKTSTKAKLGLRERVELDDPDDVSAKCRQSIDLSVSFVDYHHGEQNFQLQVPDDTSISDLKQQIAEGNSIDTSLLSIRRLENHKYSDKGPFEDGMTCKECAFGTGTKLICIVDDQDVALVSAPIRIECHSEKVNPRNDQLPTESPTGVADTDIKFYKGDEDQRGKFLYKEDQQEGWSLSEMGTEAESSTTPESGRRGSFVMLL